MLLLPAAARHRAPDGHVIVCRMGKFDAGSLNLTPVYSFSSLKRNLFLMYPLAVLCRIYGIDLLTSSVISPCAEPRPASAHLGENPLVYSYIDTVLSYIVPVAPGSSLVHACDAGEAWNLSLVIRAHTTTKLDELNTAFGASRGANNGPPQTPSASKLVVFWWRPRAHTNTPTHQPRK